jgi:hypothetical protein
MRQELDMTEYRLHWWPSGTQQAPIPSVTLNAESPLQGAALALLHFSQLGCDITAPLAHLDVTDANGSQHTLLVDEIFEWLNDPKQMAFVQREGLAVLLP